MLKTAHQKPKGDETMILLGCGLYGDKPSLALIERMDQAICFLHQFPKMQVIVSGGKGDDEKISEAQAMENYLIVHGIRKERIIQEAKSKNTFENISFSKQIIDKNHFSHSVVVVTQTYHQYRASMYVRQNGLKYHALCAKTRWYSICVYWSREFIAIWVAFIANYLKKITKIGIS